MMIAILLLAFHLLDRIPDTNTHAANARGVKAFAAKKYADAAKAFAKQGHSALADFNRGTAQVAAGDREQGSQTLAKALDDPNLRGDAFFNRGNSALAAKAYDYAIHDYVEALKTNPRDGAAKRNLEIALAKKSEQQKQRAGGNNKDKNGSSPQPQPQPSGGNESPKGDANSDALLRSVQQQEQEELQRMHRARPEHVRVGW